MSEEKADSIVRCLNVLTEIRAKSWVHYHNNDIYEHKECERVAEESLDLLKEILMRPDNACKS